MQVDRMISEIEEAYKGWKIGKRISTGSSGTVVYEINRNYGCKEENVLTIGAAAPELGALTLNDQPVSLKTWQGKYVYLVFWSDSCGGCFSEMPHLQIFLPDHPDIRRRQWCSILFRGPSAPAAQILPTFPVSAICVS